MLDDLGTAVATYDVGGLADDDDDGDTAPVNLHVGRAVFGDGL